jgi:thiamine-phosphate pyrophosphorylase
MAQLYAIVGNIERARFMLESEVPYLQLRFKEQSLDSYGDEIAGWRLQFPQTHVIVNDDLDFALANKMWGVHLGQEDADRYPPERLRELAKTRGPVLGISTHDDAELARAKSVGAAMVGFGPLFATTTKELKRTPHGIAPLARAVREFGLPVVAIGGIGEDTLGAVADTGVAMIAMVAYLDRLTSKTQVDVLQRRIAR